jgi:hypothetical protein
MRRVDGREATERRKDATLERGVRTGSRSIERPAEFQLASTAIRQDYIEVDRSGISWILSSCDRVVGGFLLRFATRPGRVWEIERDYMGQEES